MLYYEQETNGHRWEHGMDVKRLVRKSGDYYAEIYMAQSKGRRYPGYDWALSEGDRLMRDWPELVSEFCKERGDLMTSDREIAAFAFAVNELWEEEVKSDDELQARGGLRA